MKIVLLAIIFSSLFILTMITISNWIQGGTCKQKYAAFENKYDFWGECQIKYNNVWLPASNYRYGDGK